MVGVTQVFVDGWMDKQKGLSLQWNSLKQLENSVTCFSMKKLWGCCIKWIKPVTKNEYYMITHFYEESRMITFTETESRMVVPRDTGWASRITGFSNAIVRTGMTESRGDTSGPCSAIGKEVPGLWCEVRFQGFRTSAHPQQHPKQWLENLTATIALTFSKTEDFPSGPR